MSNNPRVQVFEFLSQIHPQKLIFYPNFPHLSPNKVIWRHSRWPNILLIGNLTAYSNFPRQITLEYKFWEFLSQVHPQKSIFILISPFYAQIRYYDVTIDTPILKIVKKWLHLCIHHHEISLYVCHWVHSSTKSLEIEYIPIFYTFIHYSLFDYFSILLCSLYK